MAGRYVVCLILGLVLSCASAFAQEENFDYYKKWLKEDVFWIITEEEKDVFNDLTADEERDAFIEQFWFRRDPDPETFQNEYKEEHYRRIAYANENFTAGLDGWKTDRGMIYIKFGPPHRIETYPTGGQYMRTRKEGGGQTSIYPIIRWEYRDIEGVGQDVELEFIDDEGGGLYELTFDNQRKDAMLLAGGSTSPTMDELENAENQGKGFTGVNKQARVARRRVAGEWSGAMAGARAGETYKDKPFELVELSGRLNRPVTIKFKDLEAAVSTRVTYNQVGFDVRSDYVRLSDQQMMAMVTVLVPNGNMSFRKIYNMNQAGVQIFGRITNLSNRVVALFEENLAREYTEDEFPTARLRSSIYQKRLILRPGIYKLEVGIKDVESGKMGTVQRRLDAPKIEPDRLALSSLILANRIDPIEAQYSSFDLGSLKVVPNAYEEFRKTESMGLYLQIYNFGIDQVTSKPGLKVEYGVSPRGSEPATWWDSTRLVHFAGQYCRMARMVTLAHLNPGDYELRVRVTDPLTNQTTSSMKSFKVVP